MATRRNAKRFAGRDVRGFREGCREWCRNEPGLWANLLRQKLTGKMGQNLKHDLGREALKGRGMSSL